MSMQDPVADMLTRIRNAQAMGIQKIQMQFSKLKNEMLSVLKDEGFIKEALVETDEQNHKYIKILLKYVDGESVIHEINRVSTPGRRMYESVTNLKPVIGGLGIAILTTNRGVMTNKKARELSVGGEVLCEVW